ncbi:hydrolase (HAD superfamily)-like protein [Chloroherpeton thalassium ATCC 35110]|uniref:Hydrolase (HAD superfamily)-like protein n=1 Tax=Chloroherpeton thalassium (strain ATCC 35110 / GB-78) TaxID=517418 RepID=B3QWS7_CHLT3|nr:HAD family hydrolase [Chloroherpeton thalassium]ACF13291.1 hydrolase (HAD superfamily)-like protein [Chloroherpeton thalassium ATCC 35110]
MRSYRAILFSLDSLTETKVEGVRIDTVFSEIPENVSTYLSKCLLPDQIVTLLNNVVRVYNACIELATYRQFPAPPLLGIAELAVSQMMMRPAMPEEIQEVVKNVAAPFRIEFSKEVLTFLHVLHRSGFIMGMVGNLPLPLIAISEKLEAAGVLRYFETIILSSDCGMLKPDEKIFKMAIESLDCREKDVLIVSSNLERDLMPLRHINTQKVYFNSRKKLSKTLKGVQSISSIQELRNIV